jgi:hypothetical protein
MRKLLLIMILLAALLIPTSVYADQADPDDTPTIDQMDVYRNLLETGDRLYIWVADVPYDTTPNTTLPEAFIWRLIDSDNDTELGATTGFAYNDNGYGYNVYGMYFDATDNLTWESSYTLRLSGNPSVFDDPPTYNCPINASDYTTANTSADNQDYLSTRVIEIARQLDTEWELTPNDDSLIYESEGETFLSIYGESVFRGSIYGIQALATDAFRFAITDIDADTRDWDTEFSDNLTEQFTGTWIETSKTGGGSLFGVGYDLMSLIISAVMGILLIIGNMKITGDHWNALIDVAVLLIAFPRLDMIPLSFTALICAIFVMYEGTKVKSFIG